MKVKVSSELRPAYQRFDTAFLVAFYFFAFIALVHEPAFYLFCGWENIATCDTPIVGELWRGYAELDRVYFDIPLWMRLMVEFDTWLLLPFYIYSIVALHRGLVDTPLYQAIGIAVSGAMVYAMILYCTWEVLTYQEIGSHLVGVIVFNIPWGIVPLLWIWRLFHGLKAN